MAGSNKKKVDTPAQSEKRDRSWKRGQERKQARREAQEARQRANRARVGPTPWEYAQALRKARRAEAARDTGEAA